MSAVLQTGNKSRPSQWLPMCCSMHHLSIELETALSTAMLPTQIVIPSLPYARLSPAFSHILRQSLNSFMVAQVAQASASAQP